MRTFLHNAVSARVKGVGLGRQLMSVDAERIAFVGPMGSVPRRSMGAITLYVAIDQPFDFRFDQQAWRETSAVIVPPFACHGFQSSGQPMAALMIEPEVVGRNIQVLQSGLSALQSLMRKAHLGLIELAANDIEPFDLSGCQQCVVPEATKRSVLDPRIAQAIEKMKAIRHRHVTAHELACDCGLSFSRFVHLFREQTGINFRNFAAWKRARGVLELLGHGGSLTDIALDIGFPDLSYFSNTMRNAYGMPPREMFARCAQATVQVHAIA